MATIIGTSGSNTLNGTDGDDTILGLGGADTLNGKGGSDTIVPGGSGNDTIDGGSGIGTGTGTTDTLVLGGNFSSYNVSFSGSNIVLTSGGGIVSTVTNIEAIAFDDLLVRVVGAGSEYGVQAAVDAANDGEIILVAPGDYNENVDVNKEVTIQGAQAGVDGRDPGRGTGETIISAIKITADNVTVDGVTIDGAAFMAQEGLDRDAGVLVKGDNATITNTVLDGSAFDGMSAATDVRPISTSGSPAGLAISFNEITDWPEGIQINDGTAGSIDHNAFDNNGNGIVTESVTATISDNDFANSAGAHIAVTGNDAVVNVGDFILSGNTHDFVRLATIYPNFGPGSVTNGSDYAERFAGDAVSGGPLTFNGNGGDDLAFGSSQNDALNGGTGDDALNGNDGDDSLDGGTGGDALDGGSGIDTAASYGAGAQLSIQGGQWVVTEGGDTDTLTGVEKVVIGTQTYELVDTFGANAGGFQSIQDAIDAASAGDTILIAPGTYTESEVPAPYSATAGGLYINKANLTLQGVDANGAAITTAAAAKAGGAVVISGAQTDFGSNHFVGPDGDGVTIQGLHLQAGTATTNKLLEIWSDGVAVQNNFIDVYEGGANYTFAAAVYLNDILVGPASNINSYLIHNNILNEGVYVANGVGTAGAGIGTTQIISNNVFEGTFDPNTGLNLYDTVAVQGRIEGLGYQDESAQIPTITGNSHTGTPAFLFRMTEENTALFPTTPQLEQIVAGVADADDNYTYVLDPNGDPRLAEDMNGANASFYRLAVASSLGVLNYGLDTTPDNVFGGQRAFMQSGDTVVIRSVGTDNEDVLVDDLNIKALAGSNDLNLTLGATLPDGTSTIVNDITLVDYATNLGANVDVTGNGLNNVITGNSGNNALTGLGGNDSLDGGAGMDALDGGAGDDTFVLTNGNDSVADSSGIDTITSTITRDLTAYAAIENLTLVGATGINGTGNALVNIITGNDKNNVLDGGSAGADGVVDTLNGGLGNDTYVLGADNDTVTDTGGTDTITSTVTRSLADYAAVENLTLLGAGNVDGAGNGLANLIRGNAGDNTLDGGAEGQDGVADQLRGGLGADTYVLGGGTDLVVDDGGVDAITSTITRNLASYAAIENLTLLGIADINGIGNALVNTITGNAGANVLDGGSAGSDGVMDTLRGLLGNDTYVLGSGADAVIDTGGIDTITSTIARSLADYAAIENLTLLGGGAINGAGNTLANVITGNGGANVLDGGSAGSDGVVDTLQGLLGNDTYVLGDGSDTVTDTGGVDAITSTITRSLVGYGAIENLTLLGSANIDGAGNGLANVITGNDGDNVLDGGSAGSDGAVDTLNGGLGDDTYVLGNGADTVSDSGGIDTITTTLTRSLAGYAAIENLTLVSTTGINGTGNALANVITGNDKNNVLDGGSAGSDGVVDTLNGGLGNDTYVLGNGADTVTDTGGTDTITSTATRSLADYAAIENLTLLGADNVDGAGNALANVIYGNNGANILDGGSTGSDGVTDTLRGLLGDDTYVLGGGSDFVVDTGGIDTITSTIARSLVGYAAIENLTLLGSANVNGTGNGLANALTGNDGANVLAGGLGNDTLFGGFGNDTFRFDTAPNGASNHDAITDFNVAADTIALDDLIFTTLTQNADHSILASSFVIGAGAGDADDRIIYDSGAGSLFYDSDGSGAAAQVQFASVAAGLALTNADFLVV